MMNHTNILPKYKGFYLVVLVVSLLFLSGLMDTDSLIASGYIAFIGTYTGKGSEGIYACRFDPANGNAGQLRLAAATENPSFLAIGIKGRYLYAVNEVDTFRGDQTGAVSVFETELVSGDLNLIQQVSSLGKAPAHLSLDRSGCYLMVANYNSGNITIFPVGKNGRLGPNTAFKQFEGSSIHPERQESPHAHYIHTDKNNQYVFINDLGTDKLMVYRFIASTGALSSGNPGFVKMDPGSGPRHLVFSPSGGFIYVVNELSSTVTVFSYAPETGQLAKKQTISTLPGNFTGLNTTAEIVLDATGSFLYVSNRGDDSIVSFRVNAVDGRLTLLERIPSGGRTPRNIAIDPTGTWLFAANQDSDNIAIFNIDPISGRLSVTGRSIKVISPVCVRFVNAE